MCALCMKQHNKQEYMLGLFHEGQTGHLLEVKT